jgi:glyceraldehyde 3-phosphate dehydrogenase
MTVRVGINGFGRIGRNFLRAARAQHADLEIVALNDLTDARSNAHLLRYDTTHGRFNGQVDVDGGDIVVDGTRIRVLYEREPKALPWRELGVEIVLESTGRFTSREAAAAHLEGGAERVVISAPASGVDATFVIGVNDEELDPARHVIVSNGSCTTNCFVPLVKVLDDAFGVAGGLMTTVHAYTNDQNLLDLPHRDLRRARAAAQNIVPATTGAARATGLVLPSMQGRVDGTALRVPVGDGSITDFTAAITRKLSVGEVNEAFRAAASHGPLSKVLEYTDEPIVSSDIVGQPASCIFDSGLTMVQPVGDDLTLVKVHGWYDNEWGYSNRLVDLVGLLGAAGSTRAATTANSTGS